MSSEAMIRNCAPTLAALKTGSLFSCIYDTEQEMRESIRHYNRTLICKGLRILPLKYDNKRALIYVFRPDFLYRDFTDETASRLLEERGYCCKHPERCILHLMNRLATCTEFPHEIGLFLGYPPEDVDGFIKNKAYSSKCTGYWKVYGDEEKAKILFAKYKKCTEAYCRLFAKGMSLERLTVAASAS